MKRRKEQPEKLKQKNTETGSDWRELFADGDAARCSGSL